jgi:hypothetical protein
MSPLLTSRTTSHPTAILVDIGITWQLFSTPW